MNKSALYIPRPGWTSKMIRHGYVDALRHLGWKVYVGDPKTKLGCRQIIENYNIGLIMTHSRYGIRQLPIDVINANGISVFIELLPSNEPGMTIDGPYELAHIDEQDIISDIQSVITHTRLAPHVWKEYMQTWLEHDFKIFYLPAAGNIIKALPPTCTTLTDVAMVANFSHRQIIMQRLIEPLFKRLDLLGHSYQAFGDDIWQRAGLNYNGPLSDDASKLSHVYATAHVCPNVHTEKQVMLQACVNERSFMIPLCGGVQVSDNPSISKYLGEHCYIAKSTTDFINRVIMLVNDQPNRFEAIRNSVEHVAHNHTYFNRLCDIFKVAGLHDQAVNTEKEGHSVAVRHCWAMNARLSMRRGVCNMSKQSSDQRSLGRRILGTTMPIGRKRMKWGRNWPCLCGSEKKYKNCCMNEIESLTISDGNAKVQTIPEDMQKKIDDYIEAQKEKEKEKEKGVDQNA